MKNWSPQVVEIYRLLLKGGGLSAIEIGKELEILPQAVYRAVKLLMALGCVERVGKWPVKFNAKPVTEAATAYVLAQRQWFENNFAKYEKKIREKPEEETGLKISFIQNRQELMEQSTEDLRQAKQEVCLLISGHEAPAETILEHKRALERGVVIKMLTQQITEVNLEMHRNWQRLGIQVRSGVDMGARVFIFDSQVVYITSYSAARKDEAVGVRFAYRQIAQLMRGVFERRWGEAETI